MKKILVSLMLFIVGSVLAQNPTPGDTNRLAITTSGKLGLYTNGVTVGQSPIFDGTRVVWGTPTLPGNVVTTTNSNTYSSFTVQSFYNQSFQVESITSAASVDLVCTNATYKSLTLTHDVTFAATARAAGRGFVLKITASGADRALTFPAWVFIGAAAPTTIASGKTGVLSVTFFGANETDGVAAYSVEP